MSKKTVKTSKPSQPERSPQDKGGVGAMLMGVLTWFVGPISKENAVEWVKILAFAITVAMVVRWSTFEPFKIPSGSMEPTLSGDMRIGRGDRVFVNKWIYGLRYPFTTTRIWQGRAPERWDIVVFKTPEENAVNKTLVKRIVALPGERVHVDPFGHVTIDGRPLDAPAGVDIRYASHPTLQPDAVYGVLQDDHYAVVPPGHYLVLGDNRGNSRDGRFFGWLPNGNMMGRVACIAWPPTHWRDFTGFSKTWWWKTLVAAVVSLIIVRLFFGRSWRVRKGVPEDGVVGGDHVYVNRIAFGLPIPFTQHRLTKGRAPKRGELVVYRPPETLGAEHEMLVGRVAALPGEQVYIDNGKLSIDGQPVTEPAALAERQLVSGNGSALYGRSKTKEYSLVPSGHYFIVGPEGDHVADSRRFGWIRRRDLVGPVSAVWWPPRRWRRVKS